MQRILALFMLLWLSIATADVFTPAEIRQLKLNFLANIKDSGAIVASPSKQNPDYYYDWIRDSAIAMDLVESWYEVSHHTEDKNRLLNYVQWVEKTQRQTDTLPGQDILGEPKFYLDGRPYDGPWGRPQNDGAALRALTLIRFAKELLKEKQIDYVKEHLYSASLEPVSMGVIKKDLEYTAHHWQEENFDLWEEVYGHHFFTAMIQRKALLEGAKLARQLNDIPAAEYYEFQSGWLEKRLMQHLDETKGIIQATLPPHPGPQKTLELDSAVLLAVLMGSTEDSVFTPDNTYIKNTVAALKEQFQMLFPINQQHQGALLFGRYPGDTYDGYHNDGLGNPWFLLTAAMAEYYYTLANSLPLTAKHQALIENYIQEGDEYLSLIKRYAPNMNIAEQINLFTGLPQGAHSLTWSYVSVFRALLAREASSKSREKMLN